MSQYTTGFVSVSPGSQLVTGTGTAWLANVSVGDLFMVRGINTHYEIASISTDTLLTLNANWGGATTLAGQSYEIVRDFTSVNSLIEICTGDKDWPFNLTYNFRKLDLLVGGGNTVSDHTGSTSVTLTTTDLNKIHIFSTVTSKCTVYLPSVDSSQIGYSFKALKRGAGAVEVDAADSDTIVDDGTKITNNTTSSVDILSLMLETSTHWGFLERPYGIWETS